MWFLNQIKFISLKVVKMNGLLLCIHRNDAILMILPWIGFAMGLGHEKQEWQKEISSDWYNRIVLQTFIDEQWNDYANLQ